MLKTLFTYLHTLLNNISQSWLGQVLTGAGLGLVTIGGVNAFVDYYKQQALASFGQLGAISGLMGLSGVDKAISVLIGAYIASVYIKTFAVGLKVVKK